MFALTILLCYNFSMKVAFIGHRKIANEEEVEAQISKTVERLILSENADTFYFGNRGSFDRLCYRAVTRLRERYSNLRRIYVRAKFEYINEDYYKHLLTCYEETYFPPQVHGAGAKSYVKCNQIMIDSCDTVVCYYDENYVPESRTNSGTKLAIEYARRKKKLIINLFSN